MKQLKEIIQEKLVLNKNSKFKYNYYPKTKDKLKKLIKKLGNVFTESICSKILSNTYLINCGT